MFSSIASLSVHFAPFFAFLQEGAPAAAKESPFNFLPLLLIGGLAWFLLIAPERKMRKERTAMLSALKKNDPVVTTGGMFGVITRLDDDSVTLRIDKDVHVRVQRSAVAGLPNQEKAGDDKEKEKGKDKDSKDQPDSESK